VDGRGCCVAPKALTGYVATKAPWSHALKIRHIIGSVCDIADIVQQAAMRDIIRSGPGLTRAVALSVLQSVLLVGSFFVMSNAIGLGGPAIRGDLLIYLMTGIFLFNIHARTVMAVMSCEGSTNELRMYRASPILMTIGAAFGALYIQVVTAILLFFIYHVFWKTIDLDSIVAGLPLLGALWIGSIGLGQILLALKMAAPRLASSLAQAWTRIGMLTSGGMFVANALPSHLVKFVSWNPLFHIIDQMRCAVFINYSCHISSPVKPYIFAVCAIMLGVMSYLVAKTTIPHSKTVGV
jgi:ABC-type polysaccharide/polyol phosphate export permease